MKKQGSPGGEECDKEKLRKHSIFRFQMIKSTPPHPVWVCVYVPHKDQDLNIDLKLKNYYFAEIHFWFKYERLYPPSIDM